MASVARIRSSWWSSWCRFITVLYLNRDMPAIVRVHFISFSDVGCLCRVYESDVIVTFISSISLYIKVTPVLLSHKHTNFPTVVPQRPNPTHDPIRPCELLLLGKWMRRVRCDRGHGSWIPLSQIRTIPQYCTEFQYQCWRGRCEYPGLHPPSHDWRDETRCGIQFYYREYHDPGLAFRHEIPYNAICEEGVALVV